MKPTFTSRIKMRGFLDIKVISALTGKVVRHISTPNQVCIGAKDALQRLCTQLIPADDDVNECLLHSIWCGTDATAPTAADTSLICPVGDQFRKIFTPATLVINLGGVTGLIQAQMTMEAAEGNGVPDPVYVEVGLFSQGDPAVLIGAKTPGIGPTNARMYARQVHAMITKTAAISIMYTWRFQFVTL